MNPRRRFVLALLVLPFVAAAADVPPADGVVLKGLVRNPATLRAEDLRAFKQWTFDDARGTPRSEQKDRPVRRYRGVLLRDVLDHAALVEPAPRDLRKTLVIVEARDGYRALFSWPELYLSPNGDGVYLVLERDGKPLGADEGPVALASLKDTSPGPRHVKQVASIEVRLIADAAKSSPAAAVKPLPELLAASSPGEWRRLDPDNTLYMELASGRVLIELAPAFAPRAVANIEALVRQEYFDGLAIVRVQDNYVAQWGDPDGKRSLGDAAKTLPPEWTRAATPDLVFDALPDRDTYAPQTGFSGGFPAARDPAAQRAWLVHCYATVGVGRDVADDSGNGAELYAIIGNAPRLLDRNITVVGRVVQGIELLSTLPRGSGALGFYEKPEQRTPIRRVRLERDVPEADRVKIELLRTDSATFRSVIEARRFRRDDWYKVPAAAVDVCNVPLPVRPIQGAR